MKTFVYGARDGSRRAIAEVSSISEFARLAGMSRYEATTYGCETGNDIEVKTAKANPGKVLWRRETDFSSDFTDQNGKKVPAVGVNEWRAKMSREHEEYEAEQAKKNARLIRVGYLPANATARSSITLTIGEARNLIAELEREVRA